MFFRENPNKGGYSIMAGLDQVIEYIKNLNFPMKTWIISEVWESSARTSSTI